MSNQSYSISSSSAASEIRNKVLRNTYALLSMTILFSALMAALSMSLQTGFITYIACLIGGIVVLSFVLPRFANSAAGLGITFLGTGLLGFSLGPIISHYLAYSNGPQIVTTALGGTGLIFAALSGYALTTRKDFSFMGGFLATGLLVVFGAIILGFFIESSALHLAISAAVIMLMSGWILFDTSRIINGGETNYIHATVSLYINIFNIFIHLLHLLGFAGDE